MAVTEQLDEQATGAADLTGADRAGALTLTEAARACSVHRSTLRRALDAGRLPGAFRDAGPDGTGVGPWRVPLSALQAAGWSPTRRGQPGGAPGGRAPDAPAAGGALIPLSELSGLFDRLADAERRAVRAEMEVQHLRERFAARAGAETTPEGAPAPPARGGWWRRKSRRPPDS